MQDTPTIHSLGGSIREVVASSGARRFRIFPPAQQNTRVRVSQRGSRDLPARDLTGQLDHMPHPGTPRTTHAQSPLFAWHVVHCCMAILMGAMLALAIHNAPAKIAATVLEAQQEEGR